MMSPTTSCPAAFACAAVAALSRNSWSRAIRVIRVLTGPLLVTTQKLALLNARILAAALSDGLRLDLLDLLAQVDALLIVDLVGAIATLDELTGVIDENAGTNIANVWTAERNVINDAGEMDELADTLRFSMTRMLGGSANP